MTASHPFYTIDPRDDSTLWIGQVIKENTTKAEIVRIFRNLLEKDIQVTDSLRLHLKAEVLQSRPTWRMHIRVFDDSQLIGEYFVPMLDFNILTITESGDAIWVD